MSLPKIPVVPAKHAVPSPFEGLREIVKNLWWTTSSKAREDFNQLAQWTIGYRCSPPQWLERLRPEDWVTLQTHPEAQQRYQSIRNLYAERQGSISASDPLIAYFSTEYGWHESFPIYSGGLGVLSGDHTKAASDLNLPLLGVGLLYRRGYFKQSLGPDGEQQHAYPCERPNELPLERVASDSGEPLVLTIPFADRTLAFRAWLAMVGQVPVLLLDTSLPQNSAGDQRITDQLYVRGREMRFCQEWLLGVGGVALLEHLNIKPDVWHLNEGHSAMLSLARIADAMEQHNNLEAARVKVAKNALFTTHTPVPAGNEIFERHIAEPFLQRFASDHSLELSSLFELGRSQAEDDRFNLTALALKTSTRCNGVSKLHGEVAQQMWSHLLPVDQGVQSIESITNGVHVATWTGPQIQALVKDAPVAAEGFQSYVQQLPADELWRAHQAQKDRLWDEIVSRIREQWGRQGASPKDLDNIRDSVQRNALTIGFARRFATYKRGDLITRDRDRLATLVGDSDRPVCLVFAGKAHPADKPGQALIQSLHKLSKDSAFFGKLWLIEGYDMQLGRKLVQGCDVWLNTPKRPLEASGTSGMKAALNGVLNLSVYDGWWCEGYDQKHGWSIGPATTKEPYPTDAADLASLLEHLEQSIIPTYFERDAEDIPQRWVEKMKAAIGELTPRFSARRMVSDYRDKFYRPLRASD